MQPTDCKLDWITSMRATWPYGEFEVYPYNTYGVIKNANLSETVQHLHGLSNSAISSHASDCDKRNLSINWHGL